MSASIQVTSLASGSSGNAMLIRANTSYLLIDAGVGPRTLIPALKRHGVEPGNLAAVMLTHEHDDHLRGAVAVTTRFGTPLVANRATLGAASQRFELGPVIEMETGAEMQFDCFTVRSFRVSHDAAEPVGYVIRAGETNVFYATDLGCPSLLLRAAMKDCELCILESNYDAEWLRRGPYPPHMKARVAGNLGHLSNHDAGQLIAERLDATGSGTFWLAHLSRVNNSPALAREYVQKQVEAATSTPFILDVALRDRPSATWKPGANSRQLSLY